jgi:hypothetical protein
VCLASGYAVTCEEERLDSSGPAGLSDNYSEIQRHVRRCTQLIHGGLFSVCQARLLKSSFFPSHMPPKRIPAPAADAAPVPIDTSLAAIAALEKQLQSIKPALYAKKSRESLLQLRDLEASAAAIFEAATLTDEQEVPAKQLLDQVRHVSMALTVSGDQPMLTKEEIKLRKAKDAALSQTKEAELKAEYLASKLSPKKASKPAANGKSASSKRKTSATETARTILEAHAVQAIVAAEAAAKHKSSTAAAKSTSSKASSKAASRSAARGTKRKAVIESESEASDSDEESAQEDEVAGESEGEQSADEGELLDALGVSEEDAAPASKQPARGSKSKASKAATPAVKAPNSKASERNGSTDNRKKQSAPAVAIPPTAATVPRASKRARK